MEIVNRNGEKNILFRKVYTLWYNMKRRCLDDKNKHYKYYGGKGVTICDKWKDLNGFIEDIDKIKGFSESLFLKGLLVLDKDGKNNDKKEYSLENCEFISKSESNKRKPSQQKEFKFILDGKTIKTFHNQSEAARELGLNQSNISSSLKSGKPIKKKYFFEYV